MPKLKEPFQAKLGWLIGNMYSRVATTEWNIEKPAEKVGNVATKLLKQTIDNYDDEQIKVALSQPAGRWQNRDHDTGTDSLPRNENGTGAKA